LATANLTACLGVSDNTGTSAQLEDDFIVSGNEYYFGNYSDGRFAWEMSDLKMLDKVILAKGKLGLWNFALELEG
jgi:hypothetical protein